MNKVEQLFTKEQITQISFDELLVFKEAYMPQVQKHPILFPSHDCLIDQIKFLKRKDLTSPLIIGPYRNITIFEAANRIASDLVIINGLIQYVEHQFQYIDAKFTLRLGTTHIQNHGDFTIYYNDIKLEGEAFNVCSNIFKGKIKKYYQ